MKNVQIVGGAGFIGFHLVRRLLETKGVEHVTVFDNFSSGRRAHLFGLPADRLSVITGDVRDYDALRVSMAGHDTVFHLAANPDIAKAVTEPTIDFDQGTELTKNVIEAMRVNGVKRLIYFSGSGVYGETTDTLFEDYGPLLPISTYGASKLASEAMICAYCHMFGIVARAFRFANVVGPRQTHGVGYDFLRRLKADRTRLKILGNGTQTKSYIHVEDVLNAVLLVVERCISDEVESPTPYAVYNVATQDTLTVAQIAEMAAMASGIDRNAVIFDFGKEDRGWKGDVPKVRFNCGKIHSLGWRCNRSSKDAIWLSLIAMAEELKEQ